MFVGWFLFDAARSSYSQVGLKEMLSDVRVYDAMARDCLVVDHRMKLQSFVDDVVMRTGRRCFIVVENGNLLGLVTPPSAGVVTLASSVFCPASGSGLGFV